MNDKLLTKVAKGVAFGDVSNQAIRNVLTEISKNINGGITELEMEETMKYFNWECPYTGRSLKKSIENKDGSYVTDHICSQNKDLCGLNLKGNLVIVDKKANSAKGSLDIEKFMLDDSNFWNNLGVDLATRKARLKKIKDFQKSCNYDFDKVRLEISSILNDHYANIRRVQEKCIEEILDSLKKAGIPLSIPVVSKPMLAKVALGSVQKTGGGAPELVFYPADEQVFKSELLASKKAYFILTYNSGVKKKTIWDAKNFEQASSLRGNIQSKTFWRNWRAEGLVKVEVYIY